MPQVVNGFMLTRVCYARNTIRVGLCIDSLLNQNVLQTCITFFVHFFFLSRFFLLASNLIWVPARGSDGEKEHIYTKYTIQPHIQTRQMLLCIYIQR